MTKQYLLVVLLCVYALSYNAQAIYIRHDVPQERFVGSLQNFPALTQLYKIGVFGVLIHPEWVMTSAHSTFCLLNGTNIRVGSVQARVSAVYSHSSFPVSADHDVALIKLTTPIRNIFPAILYPHKNENGQEVWIIGRRHKSKIKPDDLRNQPKENSLYYLAKNTFSHADDFELTFYFDNPSSGLELEGAPGNGDSGSPAFIVKGNDYYVLGISSKTHSWLIPTGYYGSREKYTRISSMRSWILKVINGSESEKRKLSDASVAFPENIPVNKQKSFCEAIRF